MIESIKKNRLLKYFFETKDEIKKITWPVRKQVKTMTILVIVISLIIAAFFGALDLLFSYILGKLLSI